MMGQSDNAGATQYSEDSEAALAIRTAQRDMKDGNLVEAGQLLDNARAEEPGNPAIWVAIARLRFRGGEHTSAIAAADKALELGPGYAPALLMRGQLVRDANGLGESLPWFEAAVKADPKDAEAIGEYAATLGDLGRHSDMLNAIEKLTSVDEENSQVMYLCAVLAARAGKPVLAKSLLDRSGWRNSGIPAAMLLDAVIDLKQGNADTAVETLSELSRRQPANRRVRDLYARALWEAGRDEKLVADITPVIDGSDGSAYLAMLVGRAHERLGNRARAAPLITRAFEKQDDGWRVLNDQAVLGTGVPSQAAQFRKAIAAGDWTEAKTRSGLLKRQFPESADVLVLTGDSAFANGRLTKALEDYSASAGVRRPWPLTRKLVAASRQTGEGIAATTLLSRYGLNDPRNADAINVILKEAIAKEDWPRVAELADYAIKLAGGQDPFVMRARVRGAEALGKADDAQRFQALLNAVRPPKLVQD